jgi:hypothetical protein
MFQRRSGLAALVMVLTLTIGVATQGGDRKRARRMAAPVTSAPAPVSSDEADSVDQAVTICPIYIAVNYGSYCLWYSIRCIDGKPAGPCPYTAACTISPQVPCNNCQPQATNPPPDSVVTTIDGFSSDLKGPVAIREKTASKVRVAGNEQADIALSHTIHQNVIAKVEVPTANGGTESVFVQLVSLTTRVNHPMDQRIQSPARLGAMLSHTGVQIQPQEKVDLEIDASQVHVVPGRTRVVMVSLEGDEYCVTLKK